MNLVWNYDGVIISGIVVAEFANQALLLSGTGTKQGRFFEWQASVTSEGWYVTIPGKGSIQGSTFNLQLEVASVANRII